MADPITAGLGAAQALFGLGQTIIGGKRVRRAQKGLENLQTPTTTANSAVANYYARANANPYDSAFYKMATANANRGTAQGLGALQDRRIGLAGIGGLIRAQNDAYLQAGARAEGMQQNMLSDATRLKLHDDDRVFNINKMMPYEKMVQLYSSQAAGGNQILNSGLQNIYGGIGTAASGFSMKKQTA